MDLLLRTLAIIVVVVGIPLGLIVFTLWITKKYKRRKLGYWIAGVIVAIILIYPASFFLEDVFFSKKDMLELLEVHNVNIEDDFIVKSKSISGIRDYLCEFNLSISENDKQIILSEFKQSQHFISEFSEFHDIRKGKPRYSETDTAFVSIVQYEERLEYQYYKPNRQGYTPEFIRINISKNSNTLFYQLVMD